MDNMTHVLNTARRWTAAPRALKKVERHANRSRKVFQAARPCWCENLNCECNGNGCTGSNVDPLGHVEYLGKGNLCPRCLASYPLEYHLDSCECEGCAEQELLRNLALQEAFTVEYHGSMDWVEDDRYERSHLRRRVAMAPIAEGPQWEDDCADWLPFRVE